MSVRAVFENERGSELVGEFREADSNSGAVIAHGFKGNRFQYGKFRPLIEELNRRGLNVLSFDFSGHGESDNEAITVEGLKEDLNAAVEWLRKQGVEDVGLIGLSLGGLIVLEEIHDVDAEAAVLFSPLTDALPEYSSEYLEDETVQSLKESGEASIVRKGGFRERYRITEGLIDRKEGLDQDRLLEDVDVPVKFIHGKRDDVVPLAHSRKAAAKMNRGELETYDEDHYWSEKMEEASVSAADFLEACLKDRP